MTRRTLLTMFLILPCLIFAHQGCSPAQPVWPNKPGKKILATFTPLYCFAETIAGDDANVMCLITVSDPHEAEPSVQDVIKVRSADLVLANGLGLEEQYLNKLIGSASKKVKVFEVGEELEEKHPKLLDEGDHDHGDGHQHGNHDPHIWLGPDRAKVMVDIIADKLVEIEPDAVKKENFRRRARELKEKIDKLKAYGLEQFKGKKNVNIVTQHDSLGYFAKEFKLNIVGHIRSQQGADEGVASKHILEWKEKDKRPAVFTYEIGRDRKEVDAMQKSLKREGIDAAEAEFDTIESVTTGDAANPDPNYYLDAMKKNIDNLARALK